MNATPDDVSLQRYGKNLKLVEAGAEEVRAAYAAAEALKAKFVGSVSRMATVGDDALPASKRLVADVEAIAAKGGNASSSDEWNAVAASAAALHGVYKQEHDTDDARLEGERASRQKEKRADVGYAEQDN